METDQLVKKGGSHDDVVGDGNAVSQPPPFVEKPRPVFLRESINFLSVVSLLQVGAIVGCVLYWKKGNSILIPLFWTLILVVTTTYFLLSIHGLYIWFRGDLPRPTHDQTKPGYPHARYATSTTPNEGSGGDSQTRQIEYFVWGSTQKDATVTVVCHGSGTTGLHFNVYLYPDPIMKLMNVKVISPSYPGHGGSDCHPFRRIYDWPKTDLIPILEMENVDTFIVQGASYGTAHAMATAACMPERCLAMGLQVPYLPAPICREFGFRTDEDMILTENQCQTPWIMLPTWSLFSIFKSFIPKGIGVLPEGPKATKEMPDLMSALTTDTGRSFMRGVYGQSFEMLNAATTQYWQDPRSITTPVVAVWYSLDDGAVPPSHGKWLAELYQSKQGVRCDVRTAQKGLGHFSYFGIEDTDNGMQTKVLLDLLKE